MTKEAPSAKFASALPAFLGAARSHRSNRGVEVMPPWLVAVVMGVGLAALGIYQFLYFGVLIWQDLLMVNIVRVAIFLGVIYWLLRVNRVQRELRKHEEQYRSIFEHSTEGIYQSSPDGKWLTVNPALARIMEYDSPDDLKARIRDLETALYVEPGRRTDFCQHLEAHDTISDFESEVTTRTGRRIWVSETARAVRDDNGRLLFYEGRCMDITARKKAEDALLLEHRRQAQWITQLEQRSRQIGLLSAMGSLLQSCGSLGEAYAILIEHARWMFPAWSGALYVTEPRRTSAELAAAWGDVRTHPDAIEIDDCWGLRRGAAHRARLRRTSAGPDGEPGVFCAHVRKPLPGCSLCVPLMGHGEILGLLHLEGECGDHALSGSVSGAPMAEAEEQLAQAAAASLAAAMANLRLRETLREQSEHDAVTGLHNRRFLEDSLERMLREAGRGGSTLGMLMLDIDHFKDINDAHGHDAGDLLLRALGELLRNEVRQGDVACRFGGEEFTLLLADIPMQALRERAEQICERARAVTVEKGGRRIGPVSLSIGFAQYPVHAATGVGLLQAADSALYRAKQAGRDQARMAEIQLITEDP